MGTGRNFLSHRDLIWGEENYFKYIIVIFFHIVHFLYWKCIYLMLIIWVLKMQESILRTSQKGIRAGHDNAKHDNVFIKGQEKVTSAE